MLTMLTMLTVLLSPVVGVGAESMTRELVYVGDNHQTISCYGLDPSTGVLTTLDTTHAGPTPSFLTWNAQQTVLYAVSEDYVHGHVSAFRVAQADGALTLIDTVTSGGAGPCHVRIHPSGRWLLVSNYGSGQVAVLPIRPDGGLDDPVDVQHPGEHAHMTLCDPSGAWVFVPCLGSNWIAAYHFDPVQGRLAPATVPTIATAAGSGPRFLAQGGLDIYCVNELASTVQPYAFDVTAGGLTPSGSPASLLPPGTTGTNTGGHLQISASGRYLYASNRGHNSIAVFSRNPSDGSLVHLADETGGGSVRTPRCFAIDPSGHYLLVVNQAADSLTIFSVDATSGLLALKSTTPVSHEPAFVGVMHGP